MNGIRGMMESDDPKYSCGNASSSRRNAPSKLSLFPGKIAGFGFEILTLKENSISTPQIFQTGASSGLDILDPCRKHRRVHLARKEILIHPHRASRSPEVRIIRRETAVRKIASFPQTSTIAFALVIAV
jgi:hypothetical protein